MKKFFTLFLALVATTSFSTLFAETLSFETDEEISHWHFFNGSQPNYWTIGTDAGATDGSNALYITNNGSSYGYDNSSSSAVWAYYDVPLLLADISFDWKCVGEGGCDYLSVYLVPSVSEISAGSTLVPDGSICLSERLNQQDFWSSFIYESSSTEYYLCFLWRNDGSQGSQPIAIDKIDVELAVFEDSPITEVTITANPSKSALHQALGLDSLQKVIRLKINGTINSYDIMMLRNQMPDLRELDLSDASIVANAYEYTDGYCSKNDTLTPQAFTGTGTRIMKFTLPKSLKALETSVFNNYLIEVIIP